MVLLEKDFAAVGAGRVPFAGGTISVQPGCVSRLDSHEVTELWMVAQGRGSLAYDGEEYAVSEGDAVLFEPMHSHQIRNTGDGVLVIFAVWWKEQST